MKVIRIHRFGDPEVLELDEVPVPRSGEDELLVRIHAASVNPIDYKIRRGAVPWVTPTMLPHHTSIRPPILLRRSLRPVHCQPLLSAISLNLVCKRRSARF